MATRRGLLGFGAALAGAAAAVGWAAWPSDGAGGTGGELGTVEFFPPEQRTDAPPVSGELLDGTSFDLADWRGRVVVFNWWGSWCAPCRSEAADLAAAYEATRDLGVEFLGVNVRDSRDAARAFVAGFDHAWPSLFDAGGQVALGFREVPPTVVPTTLLVDRRHRIAAVFRRRVFHGELEDAVRDLAAEDA